MESTRLWRAAEVFSVAILAVLTAVLRLVEAFVLTVAVLFKSLTILEKQGSHASQLQKELQEERSSAEVAAAEALAMIRRLEKEKAGMKMESMQFLRVAQERARYKEEELAICQQQLSVAEAEVAALEQELQLYRSCKSKHEGGSWSHQATLVTPVLLPANRRRQALFASYHLPAPQSTAAAAAAAAVKNNNSTDMLLSLHAQPPPVELDGSSPASTPPLQLLDADAESEVWGSPVRRLHNIISALDNTGSTTTDMDTDDEITGAEATWCLPESASQSAATGVLPIGGNEGGAGGAGELQHHHHHHHVLPLTAQSRRRPVEEVEAELKPITCCSDTRTSGSPLTKHFKMLSSPFLAEVEGDDVSDIAGMCDGQSLPGRRSGPPTPIAQGGGGSESSNDQEECVKSSTTHLDRGGGKKSSDLAEELLSGASGMMMMGGDGEHSVAGARRARLVEEEEEEGRPPGSRRDAKGGLGTSLRLSILSSSSSPRGMCLCGSSDDGAHVGSSSISSSSTSTKEDLLLLLCSTRQQPLWGDRKNSTPEPLLSPAAASAQSSCSHAEHCRNLSSHGNDDKNNWSRYSAAKENLSTVEVEEGKEGLDMKVNMAKKRRLRNPVDERACGVVQRSNAKAIAKLAVSSDDSF